MILAAGFGTRLSPLTEELPKPLVPVGDRPLLAHAASQLVAQGFDEIVVNTHHRADEFSKYLELIPAKIQVIYEESIRGTAGGIAGARGLLGEGPAVVVNGDILCALPLERLKAERNPGLTLLVSRRTIGEGTVGLGEAGQVVRLRGRTFGREVASADYVGVAVLGERCLATLPSEGCLIGDWALPELERGGVVRTIDLEGEWLDVGSPRGYLAAQLAWLDELKSPRRGWFAPLPRPSSGVRTRGGSWVGPGARVASEVRLEASVIGAGARITGRGEVTRCVLWPGATAVAPLRDVVVTREGRLLSCAEC